MALNKKDEFSKKSAELADFAKALSHPARIEILKLLSKRNSCICGEIVDELPLSQSTVSQHLKELQSAGLISGSIDGARSCYCINWKNFERMAKMIQEMNESIQKCKCDTECC
ncbi:MAG: ArsR/SmtB family transcription factor [Bacteroidota bacterium]